MKRLALALAFLTALLGFRFGTFAAGSADSYGYVSQAGLWLERRLIVDEPLADGAPWPNANWTLTPLGYRPGDRQGTMVPTYSPGLPIVMAAFQAVGGPDAVYYVVPLLGALAVWLTFVLGARLAGPVAGILAATALLASPPFLFQLMWPMSDVPATAWWLLSVVLAVRGTRWSVAASGLAAALAVLTRPNLVVLALPILAYIVARPVPRRERCVTGALFTLVMLTGPAAVAAINQHLYGSPFESGYGSFSTIYAGGNLLPNIANYTTWLVQTETPFVFLGLAAPALLRRKGDLEARGIARLSLSFSALLLLSYLFYTPFGHWNYLRFLLPAFPMMLALAAAVAVLATADTPRRGVVIATLAAALAAWGLWIGRTAFEAQQGEARYRAAARLAAALPDNAVILTNQHSGSLRHYAGRITMRFEWLDPDMYAPALEYMAQLGRPVYVVLEDWEREIFRSRYARVADLSWLDGPPLVVTSRVYFYALPRTSGASRR